MESNRRLKKLEALIDKTIHLHGDKYLTKELIEDFQIRLVCCSSLIEEEIISRQRVQEIVKDYPNFSKVNLHTREDFQAAGQIEALHYSEKIASGREYFDSSAAKEIHRLIMHRGWLEIAGKFRQENLELKGTSLIPPHYSQIGEKLFFLNKFIDDNLSKSDTTKKQIVFASKIHHEITHIHPFRDGNGRVARIFTNLILRYFGLPYVLIPKVKAKQTMRDALRVADKGDFSRLIEMNINLLIDSFETIDAFYRKKE